MGRLALGERFYVFSDQDDRYVLHNPKLIASANGVANGGQLPLFEGGHFCPDYTLSKFQSQRGETCDSIDWNVQNLIAHSRQRADLRCDDDPQAQAWAEPFDVLTVRHRLLMGSPTLSEATQALNEARRGYRSIHCMFC